MLLSRNLKNKTAAAIAAAGLAYASVAGAAIDFASLDGELFLNVINTTAGVSATFDLGTAIGAFDPDALSAPGIMLQWDLSGTAAWSAFVGAAGTALGTSKFDIKAIGPSLPFVDDQLVFLTTASTGLTIDPDTGVTNQPMDTFGLFGDVGTYFVTDTNGEATHSTQANGANFATSLTPNLYHEVAVGDSWRNTFVGTSTGAIGSGLPFYLLSGPGFLFDAEYAQGRLYAGLWTLSEAGVLSYATAPIPEPESWAMLLAGLVAVGAVVRRRLR